MKDKKIIAALVAVVILGLGFWGATQVYKKSESDRLGFLAEKDFKTFVPDYAARMGNPEAKVYLVEFLDPECESCREMYPIVKQYMEEFEGKVQLVIRYKANHSNSAFAAKILEAARIQGKYWETMTVLFQMQPQWGSHHHPQPELIWNYLPALGLDIEKLRADLSEPKFEAILAQDAADAEKLGVRGTPTFYVNGKPLDRFGPEALREAIAREVEAKP